jgi:peptidoglycan/xylan/chitin deacetylase (PgdA/CDA1 family)
MRYFATGLLAAACAVAVGAPSTPARADDCPGNPNALGTSRMLVIDPGQYSRLGRMQYPDSLPLRDKEVVLTFDDGPLPPYSNQILDILASECVKATYFLVGSMARAYPATVRRIFAEGHTIGTHSENHPLRITRLPLEKMRQEIDGGIADVATALGDPRGLAPFFRIPGLDRSDVIEHELAQRSLIVFSSDTVADDWHHRIKPAQIISLALQRLEVRGKGILLLHDIHPTTVAALPGLLKELKDKGFSIVQVVPAPSDQIEVVSNAKTRLLASAMPEQLVLNEDAAKPTWPESIEGFAPDDSVLPAPDASAFAPDTGVSADAGEVKWPERPASVTDTSDQESASEKRNPRHKTSSRDERRRREASDSSDHDRHAHHHARARAGAEGRHADLPTKIRAFAAMLTPAH